MTESEIYKELGVLTKNKGQWEENIPYVTSLLASDSVKVKAKALWMLGEMGFAFPQSIKDSVDATSTSCAPSLKPTPTVWSESIVWAPSRRRRQNK